MAAVWTKANLYEEVDIIRRNYDIQAWPVDTYKLVNQICINPRIEVLAFRSVLICGMLSRGITNTVIGLNQRHNGRQQNAYCMHELMHYLWHPGMGEVKISYSIATDRDSYIEWQANQGAAEMLMPHRDFIPSFVNELFDKRNYGQKLDFCYIPTILANKYKVTPKMAEYRINDLMYETSQYLKGTDLNNLRILSHTKQVEHGVEYGNFNSMINSFDEIRKKFVGDVKQDTEFHGIIAPGADFQAMRQMEAEFTKEKRERSWRELHDIWG